VDELESKLRGAVEPLLEPGEELRGVCVATRVGLFKGRMVALATTDRCARPMARGSNSR
jgi:hypothetical protein